MTEGSIVAAVLREDDEEFEPTPEEEAELVKSIATIERGEFVSGEQFLERLRADIQHGLEDIDAGRVKDFDPERIIQKGGRKSAGRDPSA